MIIKKLNNNGSLIKPPLSKQIKSGLVILQPGQEVGEHMTDKREEIIVILEGVATIIVEGETQSVGSNSIVYIPENKKHNILNKGKKILRYVYIVCLRN